MMMQCTNVSFTNIYKNIVINLNILMKLETWRKFSLHLYIYNELFIRIFQVSLGKKFHLSISNQK